MCRATDAHSTGKDLSSFYEQAAARTVASDGSTERHLSETTRWHETRLDFNGCSGDSFRVVPRQVVTP